MSKYVIEKYKNGCFTLADQTVRPTIWVDDQEDAGVLRAAEDLCEDLEEVTGISPIRGQRAGQSTILIGTIGNCRQIDSMIRLGILDVSMIVNKWECFQIQVLEGQLIIVGSDRRGTIFGIYDLCEKMGVSPWKWWADVKTDQKLGIYIDSEKTFISKEPSVKYRGIFINDEYAFDNWAMNQGDSQLVNTYEHIYELLLRLKANTLWPAMHDGSPCFHQNPANAANAGRYGIVIGTSHCEMLLRNNVSEYFAFEKYWEERNPQKKLYKTKLSDSPIPCAYVYVSQNPDTGEFVYNKEFLYDYWKESVEQFGRYECIFTMGMRGLHDAAWQPVNAETMEEKRSLLEEIIGAQRKLLEEVFGKRADEIPQLFIPYKEMQEIYDSGMTVPEDITLMWTDDNYGYLRQVPVEEERHRKGGAGVYYHVGYHGSPNSYIWLSTTPYALIREEMAKAYDYYARNIWIVNVGDLKPAEGRIEYFMNLAYDVEQMRNKDLGQYISEKAGRDFGFPTDQAKEYADIELRFQQLAYARKPEHFDHDLFQLEAYGDEGQRYINQYEELVERSEKLYDTLEEERKPSFFELQLYALRCCCNTAKKYIYADKAKLCKIQNWGGCVGKYSYASEKAYYDIVKDTKAYNMLLGGRWDLIMDPYQPYFRSRRAVLTNLLDRPSVAGLGYAKLGVRTERPLSFSVYGQNNRFIDIYNEGSGYIDWSIGSDSDFIMFSKKTGCVWQDERIFISIIWEKVPQGITTTDITISGRESDKQIHSQKVSVMLYNRKTGALPDKTFIESDGYVSMEAQHFSISEANGNGRWQIEQHLSRNGDSLKLYPNLLEAVNSPDKEHSAHVGYRIYFNSTGDFEVDIYRIPTLNEKGNVRIAIGLDDDQPIILAGTRAYVNDSDGSDSWGRGVYENTEILTAKITVKESGIHMLWLYQMDPGLVVDKIVIYTEKKEPSYFGPPESRFISEKEG